MNVGIRKCSVLLVCACGLFVVGYLFGGLSAPTLEHPHVHLPSEALKLQSLDASLKNSDIDALVEKTDEAHAWAAAKPVTLSELPTRSEQVRELKKLSMLVLEQARVGLKDERYESAKARVQLLNQSIGLSYDRLESLLPVLAGYRHAVAAAEVQDVPPSISGARNAGLVDLLAQELVVQVQEKPFGMHVRRGTTRVTEVFPGFPAQRLGVRTGCEIVTIAGRPVSAGNWVEVFQRAVMPFDLRFECARRTNKAEAGQGPLSQDPKRYRVMVVKKPFGMNVQVNVLPRVVEVLPGFPAEAAGVRRGFVLTEVNNEPVDANTWYEILQKAALPFTLTFDTTIPVHANNTFFAEEAGDAVLLDANSNRSRTDIKGPTPRPLPDSDYEVIKCQVESTPFGMHVRAPLYVEGDLRDGRYEKVPGRPVVDSVVQGFPAEREGVRAGDILIEVAGRPVVSSTWFAAFQQALPPFGLRFKRRRAGGSDAVPTSVPTQLP